MVVKQPDRVVIITPKGRVTIGRGLYEYLERKLPPAEQAFLRDFDWWVEMSELVNGICFPPRQRGEDSL